jgi:hypothetical protein
VTEQQVPRWAKAVGCLAVGAVLLLAALGFLATFALLLRWFLDVTRGLPL